MIGACQAQLQHLGRNARFCDKLIEQLHVLLIDIEAHNVCMLDAVSGACR